MGEEECRPTAAEELSPELSSPSSPRMNPMMPCKITTKFVRYKEVKYSFKINAKLF